MCYLKYDFFFKPAVLFKIWLLYENYTLGNNVAWLLNIFFLWIRCTNRNLLVLYKLLSSKKLRTGSSNSMHRVQFSALRRLLLCGMEDEDHWKITIARLLQRKKVNKISILKERYFQSIPFESLWTNS